MTIKQIPQFTEAEALTLYGCTWAFYTALAILYCYIRREFLWPIKKANWLTFLPLLSLLFESFSVLFQYLTFINTFLISCYFILNVGPGNFLFVGWLSRFFFAARLYKIFGNVAYPAKYLKMWIGIVVFFFVTLFIILYVDLHITNKALWDSKDCFLIVVLLVLHKFNFYPICAMVIATSVDVITCSLFIYPLIKNMRKNQLQDTTSNVSANNKRFSLVIMTTVMCILSACITLANSINWLEPPLNINLIFVESFFNGISPCIPTIVQWLLTKFDCFGVFDESTKTRNTSSKSQTALKIKSDDKMEQSEDNLTPQNESILV